MQKVLIICCLCLPLALACQNNPTAEAAGEKADEWTVLFDGSSLDGWKALGHPEAFSLQQGTLFCDGSGGQLLYYAPRRFQDFELEGEVKLSPGANSGVFFRIADLDDVVQTGIEMQVLDSHGKVEPDKHDFGAIYDLREPSANAARPAGEWNHFVIYAQGPMIRVVLNGQQVVDLDLRRWNTAGRNPDGTPNKFSRPYSSMTHAGYIGLQDHGNPVWYRNLKIRELSGE